MKPGRSGRLALHLYLFAAFVLGKGTVVAGEVVALSGRAMGTTWSVKFIPPSAPLDAGVVSRRVAERLEQLEQQFSTYRPGSELSRFNAAPTTEWISVSPAFVQLALESRRLSELTNGAFDVTVAPLVQLWGFGGSSRARTLPTSVAIAAARRRVDWRQLEVRAAPAAVRKTDSQVKADFSSIAKGFASDAISELLRACGARDYVVQIGGDVKASGRGPHGGAGWRMGIEEPRDDAVVIACVVELAGQGLSTSGNYRNFFTAGGRRYGHIIDPRTGKPADSALAAVSVVHGSSATSSGLATGLFVLGPEEGFRVATRERIAALFFVHDKDGFVRRMTPEFEAVLQVVGVPIP